MGRPTDTIGSFDYNQLAAVILVFNSGQRRSVEYSIFNELWTASSSNVP